MDILLTDTMVGYLFADASLEEATTAIATVDTVMLSV